MRSKFVIPFDESIVFHERSLNSFPPLLAFRRLPMRPSSPRPASMDKPELVANTLVNSLENAGVRYVFGVPGAKIDAIFNAILDHPSLQLIVTRHEQNAAFMAAAVGRITGTPGVCIATSGPGAANLTTGLATATTECDPVVALIGSVPLLMNSKHTHQSLRAISVLAPVSKSAQKVDVPDQAAEILLAAFRTAGSSPQGAAVVSLPSDVASGHTKIPAFEKHAFAPPLRGPAPESCLEATARMIEKAKMPVLFLGMRASTPEAIYAVRYLLGKLPIPTVETFQAAGSLSTELRLLFFGRVGIFRNQPGDKLLAKSDLVIAVGYDPTEYDANLWNPTGHIDIVHLDTITCDYGYYYHPKMELIGSIESNIVYLAEKAGSTTQPLHTELCKSLADELERSRQYIDSAQGTKDIVHPLQFISALQRRVSKDTTVCVDVGTVYIYMMRCFRANEPRRLLCSNGQQTLGVALPWAIAASLSQKEPCSEKVVSLSGDGGFMFSSMEMSTAVQQKCNITHFVWNDAAYNMVEFQEEMKYGRSSGITLGGVDFAKFAESFGAKGFQMNGPAEIESVMDAALAHEGVSVVDVRIDYSEAQKLGAQLAEGSLR